MKRGKYKTSRKGIPNKTTVVINEIKADVIKDGIISNGDKLRTLDPDLAKKVITKLIKL